MTAEAAAPPATAEPVLIVDDEKNIRRTLRMVLESEGYAVHEAGSAAEAESVLAREVVELILLDVKLGDDNGLDLLRRVTAEAPQWLAGGGILLVESSERQAPVAVETVADAGLVPRLAVSEELNSTVVIGTRP